MVMIMGTSTCPWSVGRMQKWKGCAAWWRTGSCQLLRLRAGQSCVGDHFAWFVENAVPRIRRRGQARPGSACTSISRRRPRPQARAERLLAWTGGTAALLWWTRPHGDAAPGLPWPQAGGDLPGPHRGHRLRHPRHHRRARERRCPNDIVTCGGLPGRNRLLMQVTRCPGPKAQGGPPASRRARWVVPCTAPWRGQGGRGARYHQEGCAAWPTWPSSTAPTSAPTPSITGSPGVPHPPRLLRARQNDVMKRLRP